MTTTLNPYLTFRGQAREAMDFYRSVFGGEVTRTTFAEFHASEDPTEQDHIMHSVLTTPNGLVLMVSDVPNGMPYTPGDTISVSLSGDDEVELRGYWDRLTVDAQSTMPLEEAPWGDSFSMCVDRFGVGWLINITGIPA